MSQLLKTFFLPYGRLSRARFWRAVAIIGIAYQISGLILLIIADGVLTSPPIFLAATVAVPAIVALWSAAAVGIQRLHDRDGAGWWLLLALVPIGGPIWYLFANGTMAGTPGQNRFGPDPRGDHEIVDVFGDAESKPRGRRKTGLLGTIALWVVLLVVTGLTGLLFQNPAPRDRTPGVTAPR